MLIKVLFLVLIFSYSINAQSNVALLVKKELHKINVVEDFNKLNLGTGLFVNTVSGMTYNFTVELGHLWKTGDKPAIRFPTPFIGNRKDFRYGLSLGAQYYLKELVTKNESFYEASGYGIFSKLIVGTPVLLNFLSINSYLKFTYAIPLNMKKYEITSARMIYGYGFDIEFWFTEANNVTIGITSESDTFFNQIENSIYPSRIRFLFGFKTFL